MTASRSRCAGVRLGSVQVSGNGGQPASPRSTRAAPSSSIWRASVSMHVWRYAPAASHGNGKIRKIASPTRSSSDCIILRTGTTSLSVASINNVGSSG
ncbi:hypothetical protein [Burkholderia cepacia]|uniref:hypothetical protein n=1 Tax=Burkholderia cepacia TaxID=292 RepID=UPI0012DB297F|nr:hypothetical protein [Burkholderia cepacia]